MVKNIDIGLNSKLNDFIGKFGIQKTDNNITDIFQDFANYIITSNLIEQEFDNITSVSTGLSQGIDGIIILVNNRLIKDESDLATIGSFEKLQIELGFVQSTLQGSFDYKKFQAYIDSVVNFLCENITIEPFSGIYKKLFDDDGPYIDRLQETPKINIYFISGKTNHQVSDDEINNEKQKLDNRTDLKGKIHLNKIEIYQADEIKKEYDKITKFHSVQLNLSKNVQLEEHRDIEFSLLATIKISELKKLILNNDGLLRNELFIENVRNFIGFTEVNKHIKNTLENDQDKEYFPYLNNGITIMCDTVERHRTKPNDFILTYPRIINGCQTTHILYEKFKDSPNSIDNIEVVLKIISTQNHELKKKIIFATNNQNTIDKDVQALNEYHEKLELFFSGTDILKLYFERLRGEYSQITPPYKKINIENLAKVFISVFIREPHKMKSNAIQVIEQYQKEKKIFHNESDIEQYYLCAMLNYWFNYFLLNNIITLNSKTADMHLLMISNMLLEKMGKINISDKINHLTNEDNAKQLFVQSSEVINSSEYLYEKRGFYSNPKTQQLISDIQNANTPTNN
ncbi:hypothetical protein CAPN002_10300 [Capnocytophaga stomatis]|uniref:AIPR family protein n=1 Tax=Capnocytophaga stomatis TaxID=1848904 RepID=UPI001951D62F|nr:AIPR family protein [Capnocytophaga stomatis]GIJ93812.1 hypothetical protein CAPN002_10300 [Capnocytophaga stomatis]